MIQAEDVKEHRKKRAGGGMPSKSLEEDLRKRFREFRLACLTDETSKNKNEPMTAKANLKAKQPKPRLRHRNLPEVRVGQWSRHGGPGGRWCVRIGGEHFEGEFVRVKTKSGDEKVVVLGCQIEEARYLYHWAEPLYEIDDSDEIAFPVELEN